MKQATVGALMFALGMIGGLALRHEPVLEAEQAANARVFEIRTYTTAEGKLQDLQRRFREHTLKLFERHGMVNIAYWTPQDPKAASNTLIYVLAHESREAAAQSWAAFSADPEWKQVRAASEANGAIVIKVESTFVEATDFSPMK